MMKIAVTLSIVLAVAFAAPIATTYNFDWDVSPYVSEDKDFNINQVIADLISRCESNSLLVNSFKLFSYLKQQQSLNQSLMKSTTWSIT